MKATKKPSKRNAKVPSLADDLELMLEAFQRGGLEEVKKHFRVDTLKVPKPLMDAPGAASVRTNLGVSQAVFAELLGVSPNTVRAWEQGVNPLSGMASRFLEAIRSDPEYWKKKLPKSRSPRT